MAKLNKNWTSLIKPSKLIYENKYDASNVGKVIVEPLERGFGLTLGNALRRVLLSSLQGASITSFKVSGILHEFSSIPGVKEDVIDIILNLKGIAIKMSVADRKSLKLNVTGPCSVTAGMIETGHEVEIMNPEHIICTLEKGAKLEVELTCETGRGYIPAKSHDRDLPIGVIPMDAIFSPIKKVAYNIENTRVGQVTDYDKLVMTIETNGTISPETALALAARILQDQFQIFITFQEESDDKQDKLEELPFSPLLLKKVDELELSVRSANCLKNDNIVYIGDLVNKTEGEMLRTQNFGRKSLNEIKDILSQMGLKFGMEVQGWPPSNLEEIAKRYEDPY